MALTSLTSPKKAAANRRAYHQALIRTSDGWRQKVRRTAQWITAELRLVSDAERQTVMERLERMALGLNEKGTIRDDCE